MKVSKKDLKLFKEISLLIESGRKKVTQEVNSVISNLYWKIGNKINSEMMNYKRGEYGKEIIDDLSSHLKDSFGKGFDSANIRRMMQLAKVFDDEKIFVTLSRELTWSHFISLLTIKDELQRKFYIEMCRTGSWSVRELRKSIDSMLFERTALSKKPDDLIKEEIERFCDKKELTPDLVFKDPYILDFLQLKGRYKEKDLEDAILSDIEAVIMELGDGFTFVDRQKKMIIDGEDFHLDLLFFHRKLKRLVAIELKIGKFRAAYKGQMELYLNWLDVNERGEDEKSPLGLILCSEGNDGQVELMRLDKSGIRVASYLTEFPDKKLLQEKLMQSIANNKDRIERLKEGAS